MRDQWGTISTFIARGLESLREKWFTSCVNILRDIRDTDEDYSEVEIVNSELGGKANLAITAYQLWFVSNMLAAKQYISRDEGQDFADILYLQVGGTQIDDILAFWEKYNEVSDEGGEQLRRFSNDVAAYITGNETPLTEDMLIEGMLIATQFEHLVGLSQLVVARAFRDEETCEKIKMYLKGD